ARQLAAAISFRAVLCGIPRRPAGKELGESVAVRESSRETAREKGEFTRVAQVQRRGAVVTFFGRLSADDADISGETTKCLLTAPLPPPSYCFSIRVICAICGQILVPVATSPTPGKSARICSRAK